MKLQPFLRAMLLCLSVPASHGFVSQHPQERSLTMILGATRPLERKAFGAQLLAFLPAITIIPNVARADVSDGTQLPQGAQQFQKVLRLKSDIPVSTTTVCHESTQKLD